MRLLSFFADDNALPSVGIKRFDDEHNQLLAYLSQAHALTTSGAGIGRIAPLLRDIMDYAAFHFADEERAMHEHDYPWYARHRIDHAHLLNRLQQLINSYEGGQQVTATDIISFLFDWLQEHLERSDSLYSGYLRARGVE